MTRQVRIEAVLLFAFGTTFIGVLAYAALRDAPPLQEQNFFLLRVIAAISSAAIAALLPGFFRLSPNTRVGVSLGAGVVVYILVWTSNPPALVAQRNGSVSTEGVPALLRELSTLEQVQGDVPTILRAGCQLEERDPGGVTGQERLEDALHEVEKIRTSYEERLPDKFLEQRSSSYVELKRGLARRVTILRDALQRRNCTESTAREYEALVKSRDKFINDIVDYLNSLHGAKADAGVAVISPDAAPDAAPEVRTAPEKHPPPATKLLDKEGVYDLLVRENCVRKDEKGTVVVSGGSVDIAGDFSKRETCIRNVLKSQARRLPAELTVSR